MLLSPYRTRVLIFTMTVHFTHTKSVKSSIVGVWACCCCCWFDFTSLSTLDLILLIWRNRSSQFEAYGSPGLVFCLFRISEASCKSIRIRWTRHGRSSTIVDVTDVGHEIFGWNWVFLHRKQTTANAFSIRENKFSDVLLTLAWTAICRTSAARLASDITLVSVCPIIWLISM